MKRCFSWILNCFTQWVKRKTIEEIIGYAIGAIIGIGVGISLFVYIDKVPATAADYEIMEKQMTAIQQNPSLLFKTNCNISIKDDVITVKFSNGKCAMAVQYDQNFKILSTSKEDYHSPWPFALLLTGVLGAIVYVAAASLITIVVLLLETFWKRTFKKSKAIKSKKT